MHFSHFSTHRGLISKWDCFSNVGLSDCNAFKIIRSWNVQNSLLSRFLCLFFLHPLFLKHSYHPVSLTLLCPLSLIPLLSLLIPLFLNHSFFIALTVPSILLPARLQPFFLTSLSFLPVFQPLLFSPSFTIILTPSCPVPFTFYGLLSLPLCPFSSFYITPSSHQHQSLSPLPTIFFRMHNLSHTSCYHQSHTDPVSTSFLILLSSSSGQFVLKKILTGQCGSTDRYLQQTAWNVWLALRKEQRD